MTTQTKLKQTKSTVFNWAVPESLNIPPDPLRARLDFHEDACVLTLFNGNSITTKTISALDLAHALARELSYGTGLLPANTLWWNNTSAGPVYALWEEPRIRKVALQEDALKAPRRMNIPLPGLIFICIPGSPPWVYAAKKRPEKTTDIVYRAPLCNIFDSGRSCPGNHKYPTRIQDVIESFFISFFSPTADLTKRSKKYPKSVVELWDSLDEQKVYPLDDLVEHGKIQDLMQMAISQ